MDPELIQRRRWSILAVLVISVFLVVVDNTIVNVALPTLSREDKQRAIRLLDDRGAFTLRRAVEDVADAMGVSRITVYNYLNALHRCGTDRNPSSSAPSPTTRRGTEMPPSRSSRPS